MLKVPVEMVILCTAMEARADANEVSRIFGISIAKGAAAEALALSAFGRVAVSPMISSIDPDICIGCQACIGLCAYSAIEFDEFRGVSEVNEAVCKGCGSCSAHCPSGAAKVRHFTDKQIFAEIDGIMNTIAEVAM
jgi:heterodisulfide reductase subunit A